MFDFVFLWSQNLFCLCIVLPSIAISFACCCCWHLIWSVGAFSIAVVLIVAVVVALDTVAVVVVAVVGAVVAVAAVVVLTRIWYYINDSCY